MTGAFIERYDDGWLLPRHGCPTPVSAYDLLAGPHGTHRSEMESSMSHRSRHIAPRGEGRTGSPHREEDVGTPLRLVGFGAGVGYIDLPRRARWLKALRVDPLGQRPPSLR